MYMYEGEVGEFIDYLGDCGGVGGCDKIILLWPTN